MDFFMGLFVFIMVAIVGLMILKLVVTSQNKQKIGESLSSISDFNITQKIIGDNGLSGLAIDENKKEICLIKNDSGNLSYLIIPYRDLLSSEIFEDGKTITRTSRTSQFGSAIIGGLALGGVGAIIGGLSGKKTSTNQVNQIDLRITVNDTISPIYDINFMNVEGRGSELVYPGAISKARHWQGLLEIIIRRADEEDRIKEGENKNKILKNDNNNSVADELSKLAELKNQGIITEEEFASQKKKLLL
jgi:hypothetical protein